MRLILFVLFLFLLLLFFFAFISYRHIKTQRSEAQTEYVNGKVPSPLPDDVMKGSINGPEVSWQGKKFNQKTSTGINVFKQKDGTIKELYPFKTYVGKGAVDTQLDTLKIDYDIPENPFWLRFILDEVVEVTPGKYLGKVFLRLSPNVSFALGYFRLEK